MRKWDLLLYPLFGLLINAVICKFAKMRPSLIQQYQNTATESTANGKITNYTSLAIAALMAVFIIGSIIRSVSALFINIYWITNDCLQIYKTSDLPFFDTIGPTFYMFSIYNFVISTCFLWNTEFRHFFFRKLIISCCAISCFRHNSISPT